MPKLRDPARAARERLLRRERQDRAQAEAQAVAAGIAETIALARARGAAITETQDPAGPARRQPYRRQSGLDWLAAKGRIAPRAKAAGERYGQAYRRAMRVAAIPSSLNPATLGPSPNRWSRAETPLAQTLAHAEATTQARARLAALRQRLWRQPDLVAACDAICGEEKTPREATGGEREAGRLEAVLKVALDVLAGAEG